MSDSLGGCARDRLGFASRVEGNLQREEEESELCGATGKKRSQGCVQLPMSEGVRIIGKKYTEKKECRTF